MTIPPQRKVRVCVPGEAVEAGKAERSPVVTLRKRATRAEAERSYAARGYRTSAQDRECGLHLRVIYNLGTEQNCAHQRPATKIRENA